MSPREIKIMESRFPQRVELERLCLDKVNNVFRDGPFLVGLSRKTVVKWIQIVESQIGVAAAGDLDRALKVVAESARSEADVSDEVFVDIDHSEVEYAVSVLESALSGLSASN